jgi:uncharacterized protein YecA (UPF0149 family)
MDMRDAQMQIAKKKLVVRNGVLYPATKHMPVMTMQRTASGKPGRNDPCPCGKFGLKYKKCCGRN